MLDRSKIILIWSHQLHWYWLLLYLYRSLSKFSRQQIDYILFLLYPEIRLSYFMQIFS